MRGINQEYLELRLERWLQDNNHHETDTEKYGFPMVSEDDVANAYSEPLDFNPYGQEYYSKPAEKYRPSQPKPRRGHKPSPTDFDGVPPGDYVCNRCHQRGMS